MNILKAYADAFDVIYGLNHKPKCAICNTHLPQPHNHCDLCESPFNLQHCIAPGCSIMFCPKCRWEHNWSHV